MNSLLLFIMGLIFLTCLYGISQNYVASWILVIGLIFSSFVVGLIFGGE
jgi:hypothetical protein